MAKEKKMENYRNFIFRICLLSFLFVLWAKGWGQVSEYSFADSSGTFSAISSGTCIPTSTSCADFLGDTKTSTDVPIGFTFNFCGTDYTKVKVVSDGYISFNLSTTSQLTNNLNTVVSTHRPLIAPLWDDLDGASGSSPAASYKTTGSSPNRVFTVEWLNWQWNYGASGKTISFQVQLYETSNIIKFVYRREIGDVNSGSASIGLCGPNSGDFLSLNGTGTSPSASSVTETTNLSTKPASGQTYTFTPPSCRPPTAITTSALATTTATIKWTASASAPSSGYEYEIRTSGAAGSGATGRTTSGSTAVSVVTKDITGLTANTLYYIYVRSNCGSSDYSNWAEGTFRTPCTSVNIPYSENFESVTVPGTPDCTSIQNAGTGNNWETKNSPGSGFTNKTLQYQYNSYNAANAWFFTRGVELTANTSYRLTFKYGSNSTTYNEKLKVSYGTSPLNTAMTNSIVDFASISNNTPNESTTDFTPSVSGTYYLGFNCYSDANQNTLYADDILVDLSPSCLAPTAPTASAVTATSATISWTAPSPAPASGYEYYISTASTAPTGSTTPSGNIAAGTTTANLSSLTASTTYYFWVRSNCDGTDKSAWAAGGTFTTACTAISSFPWTEGFEGVTIPAFPNCWYKENGDWVTANNASSTYDADANSGTQFLRNSYSATNEYIWTPGFQLTAGLSYDFSFWWAGDEKAGWTGDVFYNTSQDSIGATQFGSTFVSSGTTTTKTYVQFSKSFIAPSTGTYYFAIRINANSTPWYISFDDFRMEPTPSCIVPTALTSSAVTANSATVSWTASTSNPTNGYDIYYSTSNTAPVAGTTPSTSVAAGTTTANLSSLTASTTYYFWVRSNCDGTDKSAWASGGTFTTACTAISSFPWTEGFENGVPPICWEELRSPTSSYGWGTDANGVSGNCAKFNSWVNTNENKSTLSSTVFDITNSTSASLKFDYKNPTGGDFSVLLSTDGGNTYPNVLQTELTGQSDWTTVTSDLLSYISTGSNIKIALVGTSNYGSGDAYIYVDNFTITTVAIVPAGTSTLSAGAGSEPATISSLTNTQGAASLNFDFKYTDDGDTPATDSTATQISKIVINQGTGNDINTWSDAILGAELSDGTNNTTGTISATNITFSSITNGSGQLGHIADNADKTYTLKIWLKTTLGGTLPANIDGKNFVFNVNNSSFTFAAGGLAASQAVSSASTDNAVDVVATKLAFQSSKPPASATCNTNFNVSADAVDANGNRDVNNTASVTLSLNSGTGTLSSASGLTKSLSSGTCAWTDIRHTPGETIKIQATASGLTTIVSGNITVSCSAPASAPVFYNTGSTSQLAFNNSYINDNTPNFRLSGTHTTNFNRFRIEVNTNSTFTGTSYKQIFSGNYVSGTQNDLECTALDNNWSPVNNTTYYVRADISSDGGSTWSSKSSTLYSFTYKTSGEPEWYQVSAIQLATTTQTENIIPNIPLNRSFETGNLDNWTETNTAPTDCFGSSRSGSNATDSSYSCFIQHGDGTKSASWTTNMYTQRSQTVSFNNITQLKLDCKTHCDQTSSGWEKSYVQIGSNKTYIDTDISGTTIDSYLNFTLNTSSYSGNQSLAVGIEFTHASTSGDYIARHAYFDNIRFYGITTEVAQSEGVLFSSFTDGTTWGNVSWTTSGANGSAKIQLEYWNGSAWALIPDVALSGNSSGFSSSPKDISTLNTSTYNRIRLRINYTYSSGRPSLASWKISPTFGNQLSDIINSSGETDNIQYENYQTASGLTTSNAVKIGTFTIRDGGASSPDNDSKTTTLTDITFAVQNFANVRAMAIFDGSSNLKEVTSITASTSFNSISNLFAPDNGTKSFDVYATFKSNVTDNQQIKLSVNSATSSTSGSMFATSNAGGSVTSVTGNKNKIIVTATKLAFETNLPPATVPVDTEFPVKIKAVDANGNFDEDATHSVTLSTYAPGTGILSSTSNLTQSLSSGIYQWNDISYNTVQEFKIKASASGLTDGISILINCIDIPGNFNITAPLNATTCNGNITISWGSSENANSYDLYYSTGYNSDPASCLSPLTNVSSPYTYNASSPLTLYKFQILAHNSVGQTWSSNVGTDSTRSSHAWIGGTSSNWNTAANWCGGGIPNSTSDVIIFPGTLFLPTLNTESNVRNISIELGASLNTADKNINIYGNWINNGSLSGTGTATFRGSASTQTIDNGTQEFYNLSLNKTSGTVILNNHALLKNNLTLTSGTLDANDFNITLSGNWTNNGIFIPQTGLVTFNGTTASTISRSITDLVIFSDGFENGNQGWTLQSIANNTDWRIQSTGSPYAGTKHMSTYDISTSTANNYCRTCGNFSLDFYREIDLSDYSSATLEFYWKSTAETSPFGQVMMDGVVLGNFSNSSVWSSASLIINSYCGSGNKNLGFRFYIASTAKPSSFISIDNVEIRGVSNIETFNKIKIEKTGGGSVSLNSSVKSLDNLEIVSGTLNTSGKFIKCNKNFINNGAFTHNNGEVLFIGNQTQYVKGSSNTTFYKLTKNSTGDLIIGDNSTATNIEVSNSFNWTNNNDKIIVGDGVACTFKINDNLYIQQNCILETKSASTVSVLKNYTDYGIYTPNNGIVKFHGAENSNIIREPAYVVFSQNFESGTATGWTLGSHTGESDWRVQSGYGHNSDYDLALYDVRWAMTHDYNWSTSEGNVATIDAVSPVINLSAYSIASLKFWYRIMGDNNDFGQVLIKVNGVETLLMDNMKNKALWTESNNIDISSIAGGQSNVQLIFRFKMDGTNGGNAPGLCIDDISITSTSILTETFNTVIVDKTSSKIAALRCPVDINSDVTINQGVFDGGGFGFPIGGNWTNNGSSVFLHRNNTITFDGNNESKPQSINSGTSSFYNVVLNNPSGTASLSTNRLKIESDFTLTSGTLDANNQNIEIGGHWLNNGGIFTPQSQQVKFYGTADQNITSRNGLVNPFYTIEMNKEGSLILQDSITLNKDLWLIKGQLNANTNKNIRLKGDWIVGNGTTSGTFSPGTAMVTFNGTSPQTINKRTNGTVNLNDFTFYDLKIDGTNVTLWLKSAQYKINTNNLYILPNKVLNVEGQP